MIQVENLSVSYSGEKLFDGAAFTVNDGDRCGLVGRNGSGKTTLFRLLIGQEVPDSGSVTLSRGYKLGYLDQHIRFTKPTVLEEALLGLKEEERDFIYLAEKILFGLGFQEEQLDLAPSLLSGGYHLRLHLAKVLLGEPNCLLLDEPTNYLDIVSIRFLTKFLQEWRQELLVISHDREFMDSVCNHTLGIHRKKFFKIKGSTEDFYEQLLQKEDIHEKTRVNLEKKRAHLQSYVERFGAKASKAAQAQSRKKMIERIPALEELKKLYQLDFNFIEAPFHGKKMAEAKGVDFSYEGKEHPLIQDFSLSLEKGERVAIIGKNGYGKSTLLRLFAKELEPQKGTVDQSDQALTGYFGQTNIQRLEANKTIEEEISSANPLLTFSEAKRICGQMAFPGDASKKKISVLSGGEKSRVLLGKILAKPCNFLLLDEPTHHFDIESVEALIDALEEFEGAFVIVTHSELILKRLNLNKLVVCHLHRQELFLGGYEEFLEKKGWEEEGEAPIEEAKPPSRAEERKKHADNIVQRSKALKPLEEKMNRLEKKIVQLEQEKEKEQQKIIELTQTKQTQKLQEILKKNAETEKEIGRLYDELFAVSEELEAKKKEFTV